MIIATFCQVLVRIFLVAFIVFALAQACMGQQAEQVPVLFDENLQQINLSLPIEQSLNLDILDPQGTTTATAPESATSLPTSGMLPS